MDNQLPTSGVAGGPSKLGTIIAVLVVLGVAAAGAFYMFRSGEKAGVTQEMPVLEGGAVEEMIVEEGAGAEESVAAAEANAVSIKDFKFAPATIAIRVGESVVWTNNEAGVPHNIILDDGSYKSAAVFAGETETRRFPVAGTYPYHCGIHPSMKGVVTVN